MMDLPEFRFGLTGVARDPNPLRYKARSADISYAGADKPRFGGR